MKYTPLFIAVPLSLFLLFICAGGYAEEGAPQEDILADFHPYRQGLPQVEGITPGMQIDQTNFQVAESVLPPEVLTYLQAGDFTISVRETTDMPLRQAYIQATLGAFSPGGTRRGAAEELCGGPAVSCGRSAGSDSRRENGLEPALPGSGRHPRDVGHRRDA